MKKLLLLSFLLLSFSSVSVWATNPVREIEVNDVSPGNDRGRSVTQTPQVTFNVDQSLLEVRFYAADNYVLKVIDEAGATVYMSQLITDGATHAYMLPTLQQGAYTLLLESPSKTYKGSIL